MFGNKKVKSRDQVIYLLQEVAVMLPGEFFSEERKAFFKFRDDLYSQTIHSKSWREIDDELNIRLQEIVKGNYIKDVYVLTMKDYVERIEKLIGFRGSKLPFTICSRGEFDNQVFESKEKDIRNNEANAELGGVVEIKEDLEKTLNIRLVDARCILANKERYIEEAIKLPPDDFETIRYAQLIEECNRDYAAAHSIIKQLIDSIDMASVMERGIKDQQLLEMLEKYQVEPDQMKGVLIDNIVKQEKLEKTTDEIKGIVRSASKEDAKKADGYKEGIDEINKRRAKTHDALDTRMPKRDKGYEFVPEESFKRRTDVSDDDSMVKIEV